MKDQYTKRDGQHYMEMYCLSSNIYIELFIQDYSVSLIIIYLHLIETLISLWQTSIH